MKKMTVVFHDDELYTDLKIEAVKRHMPASVIVSEAVREWLETKEDEELLPVIKAARAQWKETGSRPWSEAEREIEEAVIRREGVLSVAEGKKKYVPG